MLEVHQLSARVGSFRLQDVSLAVAAGECHAVLGPSGSGKTTLLQAILGVCVPEAGRIRVGGHDVTDWPLERRGLGYVPQQLALFPHLTVRQNLLYGLQARGQVGPIWTAWLEGLIRATGLGGLLERRPDQLSGGERQRVGLVRALATRPQVLLLDEPFAALNESLRRELWWLLHSLQQQHGLTVLLVTHDLAEAFFLARHVTILMEGRVMQQAEITAVYSQPAAPAVAEFLGVETLHPARVLHAQDGLVTLEVGRARLIAVGTAEEGQNVLVSIRAEDVMLLRPGETLASARNRLPARVVGLQPWYPLLRVELDAGFPLAALVTRTAAEELELRPGQQIHACIKAPAVHLIRPGGSRDSSAPSGTIHCHDAACCFPGSLGQGLGLPRRMA